MTGAHRRRGAPARAGNESGSALVLATVSMVAALLLAVIVIDLFAISRAYADATAAADAAALAAAAATDPLDPANPIAVAASIALEGETTLVRCACSGPVVEVEVLRTVRTIALHRLGVRHLRVTASARLIHDETPA